MTSSDAGRGSPAPSLGDLLSQATRGLRRHWADALEPWNLSPHQARALRVITTDGELRMTDLADALRIAPRSATEVVDGLQERGLVQRDADPSDRRAVIIRPTDEGRRVQAEVEAARQRDAQAYFGRLTEAERVSLAQHLRRLLE